MKAHCFSYFLIFLSIIALSTEETNYRTKIDLNNDWQFKLEKEEEWKNINLPHDFSISQKFSVECEAESGFFPGGTAYYKKTLIYKKDTPFSAILFFYGVYKDAYVTINGNEIGENHYGYNSFAFDISKYLVLDGKTENLIEVRVEHELFSSRWYSGSGIYRGVYLMVTDLLHIALDGIKVTTPDISKKKGTVKVETRIINNSDKDSNAKIGIKIQKKNGDVVTNFISSDKKIPKGEILDIEELDINNPELWSDKEPNLYILEVKIFVDNIIVDKYSTKFGFRYFYFDKEKGFVINGIPTKLHGVCIHHEYGALGSIDNYDAAYKRLTTLKEMGINSIRTSHNPAYRTWIDICDEIGIYVIEEFFDTWNYSKGYNTHDFSEYFNTLIKEGNEILGGKTGMTWAEYVVKSSVYRDRNSPCIILWSIGNEIGVGEGSDDIAKNLILYGKDIDDTRPYTRGDNDFRSGNLIQYEINSEIKESLGVIGYNYPQLSNLEDGAETWGAIYFSESASALNSRGVYSLVSNGGTTQEHDGKYHLTSYDVSYPPWGSPAYYSLRITLSQDFVAGQYVWTGFDYIGEPTPFNGEKPGSQTGKGAYPNSAYFGIIDTAGFPKDSYYLYRSHLIKNSITVHLVTAWDKNNICFVDDKKTKTPVHIYSNAAKIELFRDDIENPICTSIKKTIKTEAGYEYFIYDVKSNDNICEAVPPSDNGLLFGTDLFSRYNVEFLEGTKLYTKAYDEKGNLIDSENIVGNHFIKAPNLEKLKLKVNVDKKILTADGKSLAYVEVSIIDEDGILNTKGENLILFNLNGPGKILGVDNGDQATIDKFQQSNVLKADDYALIKAYAGKALAIISSTNEEGLISISISGEDFQYDEEVNIMTEK